MGLGKNIIFLFVEGESEKEFYEALYKFYKDTTRQELKCGLEIINIKGIGRYEFKLPSKLKNEILPKYKGYTISVFCCYDTDVFELAEKPPTDWKIIKAKVAGLGISSFNEIKVKRMIEDWFLLDTNGICKYLSIKLPIKMAVGNGYNKLKQLFRKGNKVYQKGSYCHKFMPFLDISFIRSKLKSELESLEKKLGYVEKNKQVRP